MKKFNTKLFQENRKHFYKIISIVLFILVMILLSIFIAFYIDAKVIGNNINTSNDENIAIQSNSLNTNLIINNEELIFGNKDAPINIYLYNDYNSPYARKFYNGVFKKLIENYVETNKAKIIVKTSCSGKDHTDTLNVGNALFCANEFGKGYDMYVQIYENKKIDTLSLLNYSKKLNINEIDFEECLISQKYTDNIMNQIYENEKIKIVPTIVIGDEVIMGPKPYNIYVKALDKLE